MAGKVNLTVFVFRGNAIPSPISGILSSLVSSVEYSTAIFRVLRVWSADDRLEVAVLLPLFLFLEVHGCSGCSLLSLWVGPVSPCVSDKVDSISYSSEELLIVPPWCVASPGVGLLLHTVCFVRAIRLSGYLLTLFGK